MELDKEEAKHFESQNAFVKDSATKGASVITAADERALAAELSQLEGFFVVRAMMGLTKQF